MPASARPSRLLPLAALLACASGLVADEPARTYALDTWRPTWKVGASRTVTTESLTEGGVTAQMADPGTGEMRELRHPIREEDVSTYVQRCEALDDQGAPTRFRVFVSAWRHAEADVEPDASLTGAHLEVTVSAGAYAWKVLHPAGRLKPDATKWLDKRFGAKRSGDDGLDLDKLGRPAAAVKVGDSWLGKPSFLDEEMPLLLESSKVELSLAAVKDGAFVVPVRVRLQLKGFPMGDGPDAPLLPWSEGGALVAEGEARHSMAPGTFDASSTLAGELSGKAEQGEATKVALQMAMKGKHRSSTGGEIPAFTPKDPPFTTDPVK